MNIQDRLEKPTKAELVEAFNNLSRFEALNVYIITKLNYNLFVFIAGIFASLTINLLTNLVGLKLGDLVYFVFFTLSILCSSLLTIYFILFTIRYIELHDVAERETNVEKYINKSFEACYNSLPYSKHKLLWSIIFTILTFIFIFASFLRMNFEFK